MSLREREGVCATVLMACLWLPSGAAPQDNFEIQVYGSETVAPGTTMVELHSNMAVEGTTRKTEGVLPTERTLHETIEITRGVVGDDRQLVLAPERPAQPVDQRSRP